MPNLMQMFFEKDRWTEAIGKCCDKQMNRDLLLELCSPQIRCSIYRQIKDGKYKIAPPKPKKIPKDDGTYRTAYVNNSLDRILMAIYNDMVFELCSDMVHPLCKSYRKNTGCGQTVRYIAKSARLCSEGVIGVKTDLSKYFDSVDRKYINEIFDKIDAKIGPFAVTNMIREYYQDDTIIDENGQPVTKFTSLRQGCPFSAFLADAVLFDVDQKASSFDVTYARYSDDIIILGNEWEKAFDSVKEILTEKGLSANPNKTQTLHKNEWFKFLGFMIKDGEITLSPSKIKKFDKTIRNITCQNRHKEKLIVRDINRYLYAPDDRRGWADLFLPVINRTQDIGVLNAFVMDAIRAGVTGKDSIGKLSCDMKGKNRFIVRSTGKNVKSNRERLPSINGYLPLGRMRRMMLSDYASYLTCMQPQTTETQGA